MVYTVAELDLWILCLYFLCFIFTFFAGGGYT